MQKFLKNSLLYSTIHSLLSLISHLMIHCFVLTGLIIWSAKYPSPSSTLQKMLTKFSQILKNYCTTNLDSCWSKHNGSYQLYTAYEWCCILILKIFMLIQQNILYSDKFLMLYSLIKRIYTFNINHTTSVISSNIQVVSLHFLSGFFFFYLITFIR